MRGGGGLGALAAETAPWAAGRHSGTGSGAPGTAAAPPM